MFATKIEADGLDMVRALERERIEAMRADDVEALADLLHDHLIYVNSAGEIYDKAAYLNGIRTCALSYGPDFDVQETEARVLDRVIVLAGLMLGHSRLDGEQQVFHFPSIGVWHSDGTKWRLLAWQSSSASH